MPFSASTSMAIARALSLALRSGKFWDVHLRYQVLDRLANAFSSDTEEYSSMQDG
jgi:hypothetical protein